MSIDKLFISMVVMYRVEENKSSKFSDTSSVRADGLCIDRSRLVGGRKAGNFLHHAVRQRSNLLI